MQTIVCEVKDCGFRSKNGFCLNRVVVINQRGMCNYICIQPNWNKPAQQEQKITSFWKMVRQKEQEEQEKEQVKIKSIEEKKGENQW